MKVKLVFQDWRQPGTPDSIYNTERGVSLSMGDLHSGSTFDAELILHRLDIENEIVEAMEEDGSYPVFAVRERR